MQSARRVIKNSIALMAATLLERGIAFLLPWYIARTLGKEPLGEYSTTLSWIFMAIPLSIWGFDQLFLREASRNRQALTGYLVNAGLVIGGSVMATAALLILVPGIFGYSPSLNRLLWISAFFVIPFYTGSLLLETAIKSLERMEWIVGVRFPLTLIRVGISMYLLWQGQSLEIVFLILGSYYAATCIVYYRIVRSYVSSFSWPINPKLIKELAAQSIPFVLIGIFGVTFKQVDRIVLSALETMDQVGIYSAGATVMAMVLLVAPAMMESLFPGLARMYFAAHHHFRETIDRLIRLIWFVTVPLMFVIITFVRPAILLLFSAEYTASVTVAQILAVAVVPAFLSRLLYRVLLATNNERATLRIAAINSFIGIILNLALIPVIGLTGAAVAAVGAELSGFLQNLHFVHTQVVKVSLWSALGKPAIATLGSIVVYLWIYPWNEYAALMVTLVCFAFLIYFLRILSTADFRDLDSRPAVNV